MKQRLRKLFLFIMILSVCFSFSGCKVNRKADLPSDINKIKIKEEKQADIMTPAVSSVITKPKRKEGAVDISDQINQVKTVSTSFSAAKQVTPIVFKKTSEMVYAVVNVNIRSSCTTKRNNILAVLKKGAGINRIGIQTEWSKVLYHQKVCYIKTSYLTDIKPKETNSSSGQTANTKQASSNQSFVSKLRIAAKTNQLICIIGKGGSNVTVSYHMKDAQGIWHQQFSVSGDCGSNGISYQKKEGDKKTPAGLYSFTQAFGIRPDPGTKLSYRQVTKYDYWVDDINSPDYNTWVHSVKKPDASSFEHLIDHSPSYDYALNINYNPKCIPGRGSAIFLHCKSGSGRTTGCVAIPEPSMKTVLQKIDKTAKILIVPDSGDLSKY